MISLFFWLFVGLSALIKGADFLVLGAASIAKKLNVSDLFIGLTVVSFGTSAPELLVNLLSSSKGHTDVTFANVIGSNNFNTMLILGLSGLCYPLSIQQNTVRFEIPIFTAVTVLLLILVSDNFLWGAPFNSLDRVDAIILMVFFLVFLYYVYSTRKIALDSGSVVKIKMYKNYYAVGMVVIGLIMLAIGGELAVENAIKIARKYGVSDHIIGVTILAIGTSLPELATAMVAVYKKTTGIAIGNVIGSNIFNICFVLGITGLISPIPYNPEINFDIYTAIFSGILLYIFMFTINKKVLDRKEAFILLVGYATYAFMLFYMERSNLTC